MTQKSNTVTKEFLAELTKWEGSRAEMYYDGATAEGPTRGYPTIGVGHLLRKSELTSGKLLIGNRKIRWKHGLSKPLIEELLLQDLQTRINAVNLHVNVELKQFEFEALVSFCFNVGRRAFRDSTLVAKLNQSDFMSVPAQLRRWHYTMGEHSPGLANRREKEITWFLCGRAIGL